MENASEIHEERLSRSMLPFVVRELAGMVIGTKAPCVLTSRGDSVLSKKYSIALACLAAK